MWIPTRFSHLQLSIAMHWLVMMVSMMRMMRMMVIGDGDCPTSSSSVLSCLACCCLPPVSLTFEMASDGNNWKYLHLLLASKISKVTFSFYLVRYQLEANLLPPTSLPAPHCLASISASGRQSGVARQREKYVRATAHRPCCLRLGEGLGW